MEEKRLIDADKRIAEIKNQYCTGCDNYGGVKCRACWVDDAMCLIDDATTVDAVEVVRCRDCKYWGDQDGILRSSDGELFARCKINNYLVDGRHIGLCPAEYDFCSYGERKDGYGNG